jgi:hypothetical protein
MLLGGNGPSGCDFKGLTWTPSLLPLHAANSRHCAEKTQQLSNCVRDFMFQQRRTQSLTISRCWEERNPFSAMHNISRLKALTRILGLFNV